MPVFSFKLREELSVLLCTCVIGKCIPVVGPRTERDVAPRGWAQKQMITL